MEETETLKPREDGPTPQWIEVGKQPGPNPQEEPRERQAEQIPSPKHHPQSKSESWRLCWKMVKVLKGRGKDDTKAEHSGGLTTGPTNREVCTRELNWRRCRPKVQRKGNTPTYQHHWCQESRSPAVGSGPEGYTKASPGQERAGRSEQEPAGH